ncbi:unnamed protein product [Medioppia subpectinata]|uniref:F-box domain-containing protein n=1 Tax=Medioppia subpectinata TaxID=1979941 RepID=A0A7R9KE72_9ACAR|nr:unnamed protein product [Medioppia subpectinata]CAG2101682.1 unnamed protein product [Medioppia subpectinata]
MRKYSKDSFDRFGDDLCQQLLSFLTFEDRFRCECLSKQWRRLVFNTQKDIHYREDNNWSDLSTFEMILKKCQNITHLRNLVYTTPLFGGSNTWYITDPKLALLKQTLLVKNTTNCQNLLQLRIDMPIHNNRQIV